MLDFKIKTSAGDIKKVGLVEQYLGDWKPMLKRAGVYMMGSINKNFQAEGRPDKWKPLAPITIAIRKSKGRWPGRILQQTGNLKGSITMNVHGHFVEVGTSQPYARKLQEGGSVTFPARDEEVKKHNRRSKGTPKSFGLAGLGSSVKMIKVRKHTRHIKEHTASLPSRPFVLFQNEDIDAIREIGFIHIRDAIKKVTK